MLDAVDAAAHRTASASSVVSSNASTLGSVSADEAKKAERVNMLSALGHVISDLMRSTTTLVEGIVLIYHPDIDGGMIDGWSALIVCSLISIGALFAVVSWVLAFRRHLESVAKARRQGGTEMGQSLLADTDATAAGPGLLPPASSSQEGGADGEDGNYVSM